MTVSEMFNLVCKELPEGFDITIRLESGCGSIEMDCPGNLEWCQGDDTTLEQDIIDAVEFAKRHTP